MVNTDRLSAGTAERGLKSLPSTIAELLDPGLVDALYDQVDSTVPPDLLVNTAESDAARPIGVQTNDQQATPKIPAAIFVQPVAPTIERSTLSAAGLVTVTRSVEGHLSTTGGSIEQQRPRQNVRRLSRAKTHMTMLALRASAKGELIGQSDRSHQGSLAGHWVTRAMMEAALGEDPRRRWLLIDSTELTIIGNAISSQMLSVDELLLLYRLAGRGTVQRSSDLAAPGQSSKEFGLVFSALGDRLNMPGHRMLLKKRGARTKNTDRTGHRWYRLAADVLVTDSNLERALSSE